MEKKGVLEITCRIGHQEDKGQTPEEIFFHKIVDCVNDLVHEGLHDEKLRFDCLHPQDLIAIIATNIIMNLFFNGIQDATPKKNQRKLLGNLITEIVILSMNSLDVLHTKDDEVTH